MTTPQPRTVTAKVYCNTKSVSANRGATTSNGAQVGFTVDYADGRNKEWAQATPWLELKMSIRDADLFDLGQPYTLTFEPDTTATEAH